MYAYLCFIRLSALLQEYYQLMKEYLAEGVPVHGLGVQGHTKLYMIPDPTMMWVSFQISYLTISLTVFFYFVSNQQHSFVLSSQFLPLRVQEIVN